MSRCLIGLAAITAVLFWQGSAEAQIGAPKPPSPGDIAAASRLLAAKNEACHREAREQKLGFVKRRLFVHRCLHR